MLERVSRLEGAYEQTGQRLDDMNRSITTLREEMHVAIASLREEMNRSNTALRGDMNGSIAALLEGMNRSNTALRGETNRSIATLREDMNVAIATLREDVNRMRDDTIRAVADVRAETNSRFNNVYVLLGGIWATMVAGFVALAILA